MMIEGVEIQPEVGAVVAFKESASKSLANIPGRVTRVLARLANSDYLVSLEYAQPVVVQAERITHVDALASLLYRPAA